MLKKMAKLNSEEKIEVLNDFNTFSNHINSIDEIRSSQTLINNCKLIGKNKKSCSSLLKSLFWPLCSIVKTLKLILLWCAIALNYDGKLFYNLKNIFILLSE